MPDTPGHLTVTEAAVSAGVSARTIRRWIENGRLPAEIINGQRMVKASDVSGLVRSPRPDMSGQVSTSTDLVLASDFAKMADELRRTSLRLDDARLRLDDFTDQSNRRIEDLTDQLLTAQAEIIRLRSGTDHPTEPSQGEPEPAAPVEAEPVRSWWRTIARR